jgi:hypothetical protein
MITPYMSMPSPTPTATPGPTWAYDIAACLSIVDQHNHSAGQGQQVQPNGLNINSDLTFISNNATDLRSTRFSSQSAVLSLPADVGCLYVVGNELYFNDVTGGHNVKITTNGSVNAGSGSISGLPSGTASASYSAGAFTWQSATNTGANMDFASAILRNATASSKGLTLQPPAAMGADFTLTLPSIPGVTNIMSLDTSGNMAASINVDNSTIQLSANTIAVKALGVGTAQIANGAVTSAKLAAGAVTPTQTTFIANGSYTVPAGVTYIEFLLCGGGSGGGGGGGSAVTGNVFGGGGGGGGAAAVPFTVGLTVAPGDTIDITIGGGGIAGSAGAAASGNGGAGGNGGNTTISVNSVLVFTALGAIGGAGGTGGDNGAGGAGGYQIFSGPPSNGGGGGTATAGGVGYSSIYGAGGAGGAVQSSGGAGGGGGGAGYGAGGAGGAGGPTGGAGSGGGAGTAGSAAITRGSGGGGGGGGRHGSGANAGGAGGAGFAGICIISRI